MLWKKRFDWANVNFGRLLIFFLYSERSRHAYWFSLAGMICPLTALISLRSMAVLLATLWYKSILFFGLFSLFRNVKHFIAADKGFCVVLFLQSASWIWIIQSDFLCVRECDFFLTGNVLSRWAQPVSVFSRTVIYRAKSRRGGLKWGDVLILFNRNNCSLSVGVFSFSAKGIAAQFLTLFRTESNLLFDLVKSSNFIWTRSKHQAYN